jgi:hypothetical protein
MSLLYDASLIITPNAYKESKLYALKPQSGLGDMTVTRATTATRVNSQGLIEETPYNLLRYSEQFDNAYWTKAAATVTANAGTAPDGTTTADLVVPSATSNFHYVHSANTVSWGTQSFTISVYLKPSGYNWVRLFNNVIQYGADINLVTKQVLNQNISVSSVVVEDAPNGFVRVSMTFVANVGPTYSFLMIQPSPSAVDVSTFTGDGVSGALAWGAQLVAGSTPKDYFPTTYRLNVPRIDYSNGGCPSILVEPQRTNLLLRSEEFENATWTKANTSVTANNTISPDGTTNAEKLSATIATITNPAEILQSTSQIGNTTYSYSVYAKKSTSNFIALRHTGVLGNPYAWFNLNTGTIGTVQSGITASIESVGNGWYRCTIIGTTSAVVGVNRIDMIVSDNDANYICAINGSIFIWGAQLEVGLYPTSYIPTIASTVTRNADVISKTGISSLINSEEGTWFINQKFLNNLNTKRIFLSSNDLNNRILYSTSPGTSNVAFFIFKNNINQYSYTEIFTDILAVHKYVIKWKNGEIKLFIDGVLKNTSTTFSTFSADTLTTINLSQTESTSFEGHLNGMQVYKTALTDSECISLTTL